MNKCSNVIDARTMQAYQDGRSELALAEALKHAGVAAATAVIGTKILPTNCTKVREHCEASLKRLGVDCIYLYQASCVTSCFACGQRAVPKLTLASGTPQF
jgi:aryl-alcohol dehydrogenase-like predicted oxidoreductase